MVFRNVALWIVLLAGCAGAHQKAAINDMALKENMALKESRGLYIGHSQYGTLVVAATHYDAMNGLATSSSELGLPERKHASNDMLCRREVITGSHIPHWICRYQEEVRKDREVLQDWLNQPRMLLSGQPAAPGLMLGHGSGGGMIGGPSVP
jgi:hypothetical protein